MIEGAIRYAAYIEHTEKIGTEFVKQACSFFGPDKHFLSAWDLPPSRRQVKQDGNVAASLRWLEQSQNAEASDAAK